ncbi:DUF4396 domain-containing protein [Nonomuraea dietziae]|uniref:DUF4396 domain-containing protein n=1 Tax=Nonomuraea dietziae TaxID=65515 RepID=UPI0033D34620
MSEPTAHGHAHDEHAGHRGSHGAHRMTEGAPATHGAHAAHGSHADHAGHGGHSGHGGHGGHAAEGVSWRMAMTATLHCLTGCAIGEVLGMVIGTALGWSNGPTIALAVALAFVFGYLLTMIGVRKAGLGWGQALKVALAADTVSILVMEIVDNGVMLIIPGAMDAGLASWLFWGALAVAFLVAFVVTTPINKWLIGKGKGHAVVHAYHH